MSTLLNVLILVVIIFELPFFLIWGAGRGVYQGWQKWWKRFVG